VTLPRLALLAMVQGLTELLPVSSSAHVVITEKLLGLDPTSPEMTLLLVLLHTGTMFAVLVYFWSGWRRTFFGSVAAFKQSAIHLMLAMVATVIVGFGLKIVIERVLLRGHEHAEVEMLFGDLRLMAASLAAAGGVILWAAAREGHETAAGRLGIVQAVWIGAIQGLCLPFRGFSRSGATISLGLSLGVARARAEEFSFALAVILTPPVVVREVRRLLVARHAGLLLHTDLLQLFAPGLFGMVLSFVAGLVALAWLTRWLNRGWWGVFGGYCLGVSAVVLALSRAGL